MKLSAKAGSLASVATDLVAVMCVQRQDHGKKRGVLQRSDGGNELDRALGGKLQRVIDIEQFEAELGTSRLVYTDGAIPARCVLILGAGEAKSFSTDTWRHLGATLAKAAESVKAESAAGTVQPENMRGLKGDTRTQALVEGILLKQYRFQQFLQKDAQTTPTLQSFVALTSRAHKDIMRAMAKGECLAEATNAARTLVNLPSNICTPEYLAGQARAIAKKGKLTCKVLGAKGIQAERMHLLRAVNQGGGTEPTFIHLTYKPTRKARQNIALIGKGVTFDTGGLNIKPSRGMLDMKGDMAGAATVLATMQAMATLKPRVQVDAYIPATENVVDANAYKPSDILNSRAGKTVEVINTDAEGRLVLADALDYAADKKPDLMIDIATLTGGVRYALGERYTAILGTDQRMIKRLIDAGTATGEPMWQLPLEQEYMAGFLGGPADLRNCGKSGASTITGGLFLSQFIRDLPWIHLDIAESAWTDEAGLLSPKGGTGNPVRALSEFLLSL